jgi:hypothetical protein
VTIIVITSNCKFPVTWFRRERFRIEFQFEIFMEWEVPLLQNSRRMWFLLNLKSLLIASQACNFCSNSEFPTGKNIQHLWKWMSINVIDNTWKAFNLNSFHTSFKHSSNYIFTSSWLVIIIDFKSFSFCATQNEFFCFQCVEWNTRCEALWITKNVDSVSSI